MKQSTESERGWRKLLARLCHRLMHVWFDVPWEMSAGDVTMAMSCSHPSRRWGPWIINDTRPHQEQYESRSPHRRNKMFPLSIYPFAHCCRLHSRLLTIATNYPHFFFFFFYCWWNPHRACLSCVSVLVRQTQRERGRDREEKEKVCVWVSGIGVCLFGL